jgi:hypothetical protein
VVFVIIDRYDCLCKVVVFFIMRCLCGGLYHLATWVLVGGCCGTTFLARKIIFKPRFLRRFASYFSSLYSPCTWRYGTMMEGSHQKILFFEDIIMIRVTSVGKKLVRSNCYASPLAQ